MKTYTTKLKDGVRWPLVLLAGLSLFVNAVTAASKAPNFLFIIGEGQGWSSLSVPMDDRWPNSKSDLQLTPNLDRIAKGGMRFANFYAPSPRCTPSRAAYFTGVSPAQLHMTFVNEGKGDAVAAGTKVIPAKTTTEMSQGVTTVAELLKRAGYATAHFGKWHVGRTNPSQHGYDENDGPNSNDGPDHVANPNPKQAYATAELGMNFMERQVKAGKPFYLQVAHYAGKSALDAKPETYDAVLKRAGNQDKARVGAAAVAEDADITVGMLLKKLDQLGIADNTYVIYTTDHGAQGRRANEPLNNGKGTIWDGGLRVPLLIRGPGIKAGVFARQRTSGVDLLPTIAELSGNKEPLSAQVEGGSLVPILKNAGQGEVKRAREEFVVHFPHYDKDLVGPATAIYLGDLKLVRIYETGERRLYDVTKDIAEKNDLAKQQPDKVAALDQRLTDYLKAVKAEMPSLNPKPDPNVKVTELPGDRRGGKGKDGKKKGKDTEQPKPNKL